MCPAKDALSLSFPVPGHRPAQVPAWAMAAGIAVLFFGIVGFAKSAGYWDSPVSRATYQQLIPNADEVAHPMSGEN